MNYKFDTADGGKIEKSLAKVTPKRLSSAMKELGVKSFSDLEETTAQMRYGLMIMDAAASSENLTKLLDIVLAEGASSIDVENGEVTVAIGAIQDFFEQVPRTFKGRMTS